MRNTHKSKGIKLFLHLATLACIVAALSYFILGNLKNLYEIKMEKAEYEKKIIAEQKLSEELQRDYDNRKSDAYVEKIVRTHLGLVKPDELILIRN